MHLAVLDMLLTQLDMHLAVLDMLLTQLDMLADARAICHFVAR